MLTAEAAAALLDRDPDRREAQLERLQELAQEALGELRSLVFELRPADLEADGLAATVRKHVDVLDACTATRVAVEVDGASPSRTDATVEVFRIVQEALNNAQRHAAATPVDHAATPTTGASRSRSPTTASASTRTRPGCAGAGSGLTSMEERARARSAGR